MAAAAGNRTQPQVAVVGLFARRMGWATSYNINFNSIITSTSPVRCPAFDFVSHCGSLAALCCATAVALMLVVSGWYGGDGPHLLARRLTFGLLSEMETTLTPISSGMDFTT